MARLANREERPGYLRFRVVRSPTGIAVCDRFDCPYSDAVAGLGGQRADGALSVTQHRSALGCWERAWRRPSPPLRRLVAGYTGYHQHLAAPATHRGIPSPGLPLVINFGSPQTIVAPHAGRGAVVVDSFLAGVHDRYVLIDADDHYGIQVDLGPLAAYRLLGQPLKELTGQTLPLDALFGRAASRLIDDLACAPDWPTRFGRLDRFLIERLSAHGPPAPEVARAWGRIVASRGQVRIGALATEVGWGQRHLTARFGEALGLSPKRMARLVRFDHAVTLLSRPAAAGWADIAVIAGYYDQAHLANEIRAFTGLTPRQLRSRQLPDDGGVFDVDVS